MKRTFKIPFLSRESELLSQVNDIKKEMSEIYSQQEKDISQIIYEILSKEVELINIIIPPLENIKTTDRQKVQSYINSLQDARDKISKDFLLKNKNEFQKNVVDAELFLMKIINYTEEIFEYITSGASKKLKELEEREMHETEIIKLNMELWDYILKEIRILIARIEKFSDIEEGIPENKKIITRKIEEIKKQFNRYDELLDVLKKEAGEFLNEKKIAKDIIEDGKKEIRDIQHLQERYYKSLDTIEKETIELTYKINKEVIGEIISLVKSDDKSRILGVESEYGTIKVTSKGGIINNFSDSLSRFSNSFSEALLIFEKETAKRSAISEKYSLNLKEIAEIIKKFKKLTEEFNYHIKELNELSIKANESLLKDKKHLKKDFDKSIQSLHDFENNFLNLQATIRGIKDIGNPKEYNKTKSSVQSYFKELSRKVSSDKAEIVIKSVKIFSKDLKGMSEDEKKFYNQLGEIILNKIIVGISKIAEKEELYKALCTAFNSLRAEIISSITELNKDEIKKIDHKELIRYSERQNNLFVKGMAMESAKLETEILGNPIGEWESSELGRRRESLLKKLQDLEPLRIAYNDFEKASPDAKEKMKEVFITSIKNSLKQVDEMSLKAKTFSNHFRTLMNYTDELIIFAKKLDKGLDEYKKEISEYLQRVIEHSNSLAYNEMKELIKKEEGWIRISRFIAWAHKRDVIKHVSEAKKYMREIYKETYNNAPFILAKMDLVSGEKLRKGLELLKAVDSDIVSSLKKFSSHTAEELASELISRIKQAGDSSERMEKSLEIFEEIIGVWEKQRHNIKERTKLRGKSRDIEAEIQRVGSTEEKKLSASNEGEIKKKVNDKGLEAKKNELEKTKSEIKILKEEEERLVDKMASLMERGREVFNEEMKAFLAKSNTEVSHPESNENSLEHVKKEFYERSKMIKNTHKEIRELTHLVNKNRNVHVLSFVMEFISYYEGIDFGSNIETNSAKIREIISSWANNKKYKNSEKHSALEKHLKEFSSLIEKSVLKSISSFKTFAIVFFSAEKILGDLITLLTGKDVIKTSQKQKDFVNEITSMSLVNLH
ncbi:MAG: hypothetical protein PHW96_04075 [Candidatus Nanoarchaeia archaeon]|nr:hypothetical protein [Candidatus Nanoarchaeia archaeon]